MNNQKFYDVNIYKQIITKIVIYDTKKKILLYYFFNVYLFEWHLKKKKKIMCLT